MRKVIFQYWIPRQVRPRQDATTKSEDVPGTNCFSELQSGYFHCWGYELHDSGDAITNESVAIVEHITSGHVYRVDPQKMRFVLPPDKTQAPEVIGQLIINDATGNELIDLLKSINSKL